MAEENTDKQLDDAADNEVVEVIKRDYELSFLVTSPDVESAVVNMVRSAGGEIVTERRASEIKLAYPIKKHISANFGYIIFRAPAAVAAGLRAPLQSKEGLVRFLIVSAMKPRIRPAIPEGLGEISAGRGSIVEKTEPVRKPAPAREVVTNKALEEKLEEILK